MNAVLVTTPSRPVDPVVLLIQKRDEFRELYRKIPFPQVGKFSRESVKHFILYYDFKISLLQEVRRAA